MGQYLPIVAAAGARRGVRRAQLRRLATARTAPPVVGQGSAVRVRHRARREPPERFPVSFYVVAMLFIMFDIEIIFIYPFAVSRAYLGMYGFWAMVIFSACSSSPSSTRSPAVGSTGVRCGAPPPARAADAAIVSATSGHAASTIRRVGTEGRPTAEPKRRPSSGPRLTTSPTTDSVGSPTTSSPASSRPRQLGPVAQSRGRPTSGSPAARSR